MIPAFLAWLLALLSSLPWEIRCEFRVTCRDDVCIGRRECD